MLIEVVTVYWWLGLGNASILAQLTHPKLQHGTSIFYIYVNYWGHYTWNIWWFSTNCILLVIVKILQCFPIIWLHLMLYITLIYCFLHHPTNYDHCGKWNQWWARWGIMKHASRENSNWHWRKQSIVILHHLFDLQSSTFVIVFADDKSFQFHEWSWLIIPTGRSAMMKVITALCPPYHLTLKTMI